MTRQCIDCHQHLPETFFGPKGGPGRERHLASVCKPCKAERARVWRAKQTGDPAYHEHERLRMRLLRARKRGETDERLPDRRHDRPKQPKVEYPWETWH